MKCKSCKAELPGSKWFRIRFRRETACLQCGERYPTIRQLRFEAAIYTVMVLIVAMFVMVYERGWFVVAFAVLLAALAWTEYAVISKRRRGLAPASIPPD